MLWRLCQQVSASSGSDSFAYNPKDIIAEIEIVYLRSEFSFFTTTIIIIIIFLKGNEKHFFLLFFSLFSVFYLFSIYLIPV